MSNGDGTPKPEERPPAPKLPDGAPKEVREFVGCRGRILVMQDGPIDWVSIPGGIGLGGAGAPTATFSHFADTVSITVTWGAFTVRFKVTVVDGQLHVDTSEIPEPLSGISEAVKKWADRLNRWFAANGHEVSLSSSSGARGYSVHLLKSPADAGREKKSKGGVKKAAAVGAAAVAIGGAAWVALWSGGGDGSTPQAGASTEEQGGAGGGGLSDEEVPGEIVGEELGTSPATFRRENGDLVVSLSDGEIVYRGPIDADGRFRLTWEDNVFEGTLTGNTVEGAITGPNTGSMQVTGRLFGNAP